MIEEIGNKYTPEDLKDKINELIRAQNQAKNEGKECSCKKSYPADFDNKHDKPKEYNPDDYYVDLKIEYMDDKPKSAIDKAREYYEKECNMGSLVNGGFLKELKTLYEKAYEQKEKELMVSREICEALNDKIRQLEKENENLKSSIKIYDKKNIELFQEFYKLKQQSPEIDEDLIEWLKSWDTDICNSFSTRYSHDQDSKNMAKLKKRLGVTE
jgi:hypothetical protein